MGGSGPIVQLPRCTSVSGELTVRPRTPQEKKSLSLERDCRNAYGESPHGARRSIPLRKRLATRAARRLQESWLPTQPMQITTDQTDQIGSSIWDKPLPSWPKMADAPMGEVIEKKQRRSDAMSPALSPQDLVFPWGQVS